jgi:hypothetical protein
MNRTQKLLLFIAATSITAITACNYTVGECWYRGEGPGREGEGGGVLIPGAGGSYGEEPPQGGTNPPPECNSDGTESETEKPTESTCTADGTVNDGTTFLICSDACPTPCAGVNGYSPALFQFVTLIADDGTGDSGGWQAASVVLKVKRWIGVFPEVWECPQLTFGTPLRNTVQGKISAEMAAVASAKVATEESGKLKDVEEQGIYCFKLKQNLQLRFPLVIAGATVKQP